MKIVLTLITDQGKPITGEILGGFKHPDNIDQEEAYFLEAGLFEIIHKWAKNPQVKKEMKSETKLMAYYNE